MKSSEMRVCGVILAGGRGSRMQYRHKPLMTAGRQTILQWIIENAENQAGRLLINVNRDLELYESFGLPLISDLVIGDSGPLAGIQAAMHWCRENDPACTHIACFPGDVPWFDSDLVQRLSIAMLKESSSIGWLRTAEQWQPLFSLWDMAMERQLADALQLGLYSPMQFIRSQPNALVTLVNLKPGDYMNINTEEDLLLANKIADQRFGR
jgi:molybdenum cofactor guanylyltransferase